MKQIKEDSTRDMEDREHASTVLGCIEGEIEWEKEQNSDLNGSDLDVGELFS